ncbi:hypothetical protein [Streptomyces sp. 7N604]|uniref:hypothetical protein n=1 Tax=Streptomyces sp. 7N604 TaxID=3457415 RepID=UPI003FD1EBAC
MSARGRQRAEPPVAVSRTPSAYTGKVVAEVRSSALVMDAGESDSAPLRSTCAPGGQFFEAWMKPAAQGVRPAVVLAGHARDSEHLAARGTTEVITPDQVA